MNSYEREIVVPEEAKNRGRILRGDLTSPHLKIPGILVQFSKVLPQNREAELYVYPTLEQAKALFNAQPPFTFVGSSVVRVGVEERWEAPEIWLNHGTQITANELCCFTHCSGPLTTLDVISSSAEHRQKNRSAWFFTTGCFLLHIVATREQRDEQLRDQRERPNVHRFSLSDGATAEFKRITMSHSMTLEAETNTSGYVIDVQGFTDKSKVKKEVDGLLILASLASRERTHSWYWSFQESEDTHAQHWDFGTKEWQQRSQGEEPLLPRNQEACRDFLATALRKYINSSNTSLFDSAVFALLNHDLQLETRIVRLFSGLQSALLFAAGLRPKAKRAQMKDLFTDFENRYAISLGDLWPLFDKSNGPSLSEIRNAIVHGEVFAPNDFEALSYASENLQWILERVLVTALGWDVASSAVSPGDLKNYCAYYWQSRQQRMQL